MKAKLTPAPLVAMARREADDRVTWEEVRREA
jgi:hypothetical protein